MGNKKEIISYLVFGVLTTAISVISFWLFGIVFGEQNYLINNILRWVIAVAFAFVTNKLWVFSSKDWSVKVLKTELTGFLLARNFSLLLEEAGLFLLIDILYLSKYNIDILNYKLTGELISKLIMQFIVIAVNYILSKLVIFKKKNRP